MSAPQPDHVRRDRIVERLEALVRIPSLTGQEGDAVAYVAEQLRALGVDTLDHWSDAMHSLEEDPAYPGREVERDTVPVVAARVEGRHPGPTLVFNGHVDVVPVGDRRQWTFDPFGAEIRGDRLYGRGACDMKAGVVAALEVFEVFARNRDFAGAIVLVAVPGEEDGGTGTLAALRRGWTGDACIIAEPTSGVDGPPGIVVAHGGALTYTVRVEGRSAHASKRLEGESAFEHFVALHEAMRRDEQTLNEGETDPVMRALGLPYPTSVGIISGGEWSASVMDQLEAEVRVGVAIDESVADADVRFRQALLDAARKRPWLRDHPPIIERTGAAFGSAAIDRDHALVEVVRAAALEEWGEAELAGAPYGCDMALWQDVGDVPTLVYGPGDARLAHAPDEWVSLDETAGVARVFVRAARRFLEQPSPRGSAT